MDEKRRRTLVIIGGGPAGASLANYCDQQFRVVLIDVKDFFEYTPSILSKFVARPLTFNKWKELTKSYNRIVRHGEVIVGTVDEVTLTYVRVGSQLITFDFLCICSGSSREGDIWKVPLSISSREQRWEQLIEHRRQLESAETVLIIGGGTVGVELAGEISAAFPKKKITIVHSGPELLPRLPEALRKRVHSYFRYYTTCDVIVNQHVLRLSSNQFKLEPSGQELTADIVFECINYSPNTSFLRQNFQDYLDDRGRVRVTPALHLNNLPNIFALGDVNNFNEEKTLSAATRHADHVANILTSGKAKPYPGTIKAQIVSLGPTRGVFHILNINFIGWTSQASLLAVPFKYFNQLRMFLHLDRGFLAYLFRTGSAFIDYLAAPGPHAE